LGARDQRGSAYVERVTLVAIVAILVGLGVPHFLDGEADAHRRILHHLRDDVEDAIRTTRSLSVTKGHPGFVVVDGRRIRLIGGYPAPVDVPVLARGASELATVMEPRSVEFRMPSAPDPEHCVLRYELARRADEPPSVTIDDHRC
jgi:hypothetical protein